VFGQAEAAQGRGGEGGFDKGASFHNGFVFSLSGRGEEINGK
jgi:hypothetical protein